GPITSSIPRIGNRTWPNAVFAVQADKCTDYDRKQFMDTLTRMRAFLLVVEAEGFSAAARKGGRSKALLSKYVRELEDELGVLLINRTTRRLSLTEAGSTYYQRAGELVREIDQLSDVIR